MGSCQAGDIGKIDKFNKNYRNNDKDNSAITLFINVCKLKYIGQNGFKDFCELKLLQIQILKLGYNQIADIDCFVNFEAPKLKALGLECNYIVNIDIFRKVIYPLEELDLRYNKIKDITIFKEDTTLPKLKILLISNNEYEKDNEDIKKILEHLTERMKKNDKDSELQSNNDNDYKNLCKRIKTLNDKFINDQKINDQKNKIELFGKYTVENLENFKNNNENEDEKKEIDDIVKKISKLKNSIKKSGSKTLTLSNNVEDNRINNSRSFEINNEEED